MSKIGMARSAWRASAWYYFPPDGDTAFRAMVKRWLKRKGKPGWRYIH